MTDRTKDWTPEGEMRELTKPHWGYTQPRRYRLATRKEEEAVVPTSDELREMMRTLKTFR